MEEKIKELNWFNLPNKLKEILPRSSSEVGNGTITITQGGNPKGSFTTNQSGNTTIDIDAGGGGGSADLMVEITHANLLTLVNNGGLTKGQQYRITDYVATVNTDVYKPDGVGFFARSNNHVFDIIVTADSASVLNENARAIRHNGDTYFPGHTKLEAWKIKYTIFNDSERFDWALSTGKGVIYQMIDEWNNDVPYDFKSIQFQRNDVWVYTFGGVTDASLEIQNCYGNIIKPASTFVNDYGCGLNNNIFGNNSYLNVFGYGCYSNTLGNNFKSNTFGDDCSLNTFGYGCQSNTLGYFCSYNTFGYNCALNTLGYFCYSNTLSNECRLNTLGNECQSNTLGDACSSNIFRILCASNTLGYFCSSNRLGDENHSNTIGNNSSFNILGDNKANFQVDSRINNINFNTQLSNFTTPPNGNTVVVIKTPTGVVMQQRINATTTESFDVV